MSVHQPTWAPASAGLTSALGGGRPDTGGFKPVRSRARLLPFAALLLFFVSLPVRSPWLSVLASGLFIVPFFYPLKVNFRFRRGLPSRAVVGSPVRCTFAVTNTGRMATPPAVLTDPVPGFAALTIALPPLRPGETAEIDLLAVPIARSRTELPWALSVRQQGWFAGAMSMTTQMSGAPIVRPRLMPWPGALPLLARDVIGAGEVRVGEGTDIHGLRAWRPGDAPRAVHWRSTARVGSPMVLERAEEYSREVVLIVADGGTGGPWEDGVSRAAWLARAAAVEGCRLTLIAGAGARLLAQGASEDDVQDWFAGLQSVGSVDVAAIANELRRTRASGEVAVLTANPALVVALAQCSPRVRVVEAVRSAPGARSPGAVPLHLVRR